MDHTDYDSLPIPSYEEAIASRPASSQGPGDQVQAEREGLLHGTYTSTSATNGAYQNPTVESVRSSIDSDLSLPEIGDDQEADSLRRDMEEMDIDDQQHTSSTSSRLRQGLSKRFKTIASSLTAFHMPSFRTSTLASVLQSLYSKLPHPPENYRITVPIVARFIGLCIVGLLLYALLTLDVMPSRSYLATRYDPESVRARAMTEIQETRIAGYLRYITSYDHVAGTEGDVYLAKWQREVMEAAALDKVYTEDYYVHLNYPTANGRAVTVADESGKEIWKADLEENTVNSEDGKQQQQTLSFHGLSKTGTVTGRIIYANYGSGDDYKALADLKLKAEGAVVLVRASSLSAGEQVQAAEAAGAIGCLIFNDPKTDGNELAKTFPDGRWSPSDAVHRASVGLSRVILGDVLTPGEASNVKSKRIKEGDNPALVGIPSLPIAWKDAKHLLQFMKGHGKEVPSSEWIGGVPDVNEWRTGGPKTHKVTLRNEQDENKMQTIWNVHGLIEGGEDKNSKIIVGNHRDSWCFGSVDPGSGTAVMMEVVTIFGALKALGWRPLRTIEFVGWDAGAYNMIGSTESVEDHVDNLRANAYAYLNVDVGVYGRHFRASGSPVFQRSIEQVLERMSGLSDNTTMREAWSAGRKTMPPASAVGDHVPFHAIAGVSTLDLGLEGEPNSYPAHSCYETYEWTEKYGDPGFQYHKLLAQIWTLLILELADRPIIPFDLNVFAGALHEYVDTLEKHVDKQELDLGPLHAAADELTTVAAEFHHFDDYWSATVLGGGRGYEKSGMNKERREHNRRLIAFEKSLLDLPGLKRHRSPKEHHGVPGREQYKHVIFGPSAKPGKDDTLFPGIRDAIDEKNMESARRQIQKTAKRIRRAAAGLRGGVK